jgi:hypothetical protein
MIGFGSEIDVRCILAGFSAYSGSAQSGVWDDLMTLLPRCSTLHDNLQDLQLYSLIFTFNSKSAVSRRRPSATAATKSLLLVAR